MQRWTLDTLQCRATWRALHYIPDWLCSLAVSSYCPTESWLALSTFAVEFSLHRQHMPMSDAFTSPRCWQIIQRQCLKQVFQLVHILIAWTSLQITYKPEGAASSGLLAVATEAVYGPAFMSHARATVRCAARGPSFMYLIEAACDGWTRGLFCVVHEPVLRARMCSHITARYINLTPRAYLPIRCDEKRSLVLRRVPSFPKQVWEEQDNSIIPPIYSIGL